MSREFMQHRLEITNYQLNANSWNHSKDLGIVFILVCFDKWTSSGLDWRKEAKRQIVNPLISNPKRKTFSCAVFKNLAYSGMTLALHSVNMSFQADYAKIA